MSSWQVQLSTLLEPVGLAKLSTAVRPEFVRANRPVEFVAVNARVVMGLGMGASFQRVEVHAPKP
jgi:hypothetical protein